MPLKTDAGVPNWELCAWVIINKLLVGKNRRFSRSEFMTLENLSLMEFVTSKALQHKRNPQHVMETLQRTIQNMRDKGHIDFLGQGEYRLTDAGVKKAEEMRSKYSYDKWMSVFKAPPNI
jgi:hypothetical protein